MGEFIGAAFTRETGSPLTPLQHSLNIYRQYMLNVFFKNMIGRKDSGKPIILESDKFRGKEAGDTARFHFVPQFRGKGLRGQNPSVIGNENVIEEYYMDLRVDQITQAFAKRGKMTEIRTILNFREEFKNQLAEWFRVATEEDIICSLSGYNDGGAIYLDADENPDRDAVNGSGRCIRPDYNGSKFTAVSVSSASSDTNSLLSDLTTSDTMNTQLLDVLQDFAKTGNSKYAMRPIHAKNGEEYYMLVLHPKAAISLRNDPRWEKRALSAYEGKATLENDPIANGIIGIWEHIIVKEAQHIMTHTNSAGSLTIARNLLLGAEAAVIGYAQELDYSEQLDDHKRRMSVCADEIRGINKLTFDGVDLNVAQVPCAIETY